MTAKELIEAAMDVQAASHPIVFVQRSMVAIANHILATVREDDDEPVTPKSMGIETGWEWKDWIKYHDEYRRNAGDIQLDLTIYKGVANLWIESGENGLSVEPIKSMGHLRRLVAALGE